MPPHDAAHSGRANRLINETSPYLLQHAYNPVDWHPWGEEAFARARNEDKPVFLSVGYSACHWCHVMERESFENPDIAAVMNEHYINIKVDREERPDVDQIYMSAVQLMTHRGGWPMSVFMTPDGRPFYGGTYWPPTSQMGMPGFRDILLKLHEYWTQKRDEVDASAGSLVDAIRRMSAPEFGQSELNDALLRGALRGLLSSADRREGGFGEAPKFPHPMDLRVLLRCWKRFGDADALHVARLTLDKMAQGGIYDHLGGGFHRYSTDVRWLVPHFEKMLYDNALLVPAYLELMQCVRDPAAAATANAASLPASEYARIATETLDYVLREMTSPEAGFHSTQDADSEGEEGKFFVWTEDEILALLGPDEGRVFSYAYDVTTRGNWEHANILNRPKNTRQAAQVLGVSPDELEARLDAGRRRLFAARARRIAPGRDDKILVAWNGLMISAMARGSLVLHKPEYAAAASRAADFILTRMRDQEGRLRHTFKDGRAAINAFLDDYACLIDGLVDLYEATFEARWLTAALELAGQLIDRFSDAGGDFFYTPSDHERLIARSKDSQDNATPSGNGMAATSLLRLGRITGRTDLEDRGRRVLAALSGLLAEHPRAAAQALLALDFELGPTLEIVLIDGDDRSEADRVLSELHARFVPNRVVVRRSGNGASDDRDLPKALEPLWKGRSAVEGRVTAYFCERGTCGLPVSGVAEIVEELQRRATHAL